MFRSRVAVLLVLMLALAALITGCGPSVPDIVGMKQADAVRALEEAGYKLGNVNAVATKDVPLNTVAATNPPAGESAREGTAIDVSVNLADGETVIVPNVSDMEQVTAEGIAKTLGLTGVVAEQYSDTAPKGTVFEQVPTAGSEVVTGDTLVMVVSKGAEPAKAKVPSVTGKSQANADSALKSAGFVMAPHSVYDSKVANGAVIAQVPASGATAKVGSEVDVLISLGPGTGSIKMPNVVGKSEADAKSAISSAGLAPVVVKTFSDTIAKGKVIAQFPDAGTTAAKGSEALIQVSLGKESTSVEVPDVSGMTEADAVAALEAAGLVATVQPVANDTATPGTVYFQFPAGKTQAAPGSGVLVVVAP